MLNLQLIANILNWTVQQYPTQGLCEISWKPHIEPEPIFKTI